MSTTPSSDPAPMRQAIAEHQPWCGAECRLPGTADGSRHYGRCHVMAWDPAVVGGRNEPELEELAVRPVLHHGYPILDIEVDTATSGCENAMWLTPGEARRYAEAILRAVDEIAPATVTPLDALRVRAKAEEIRARRS